MNTGANSSNDTFNARHKSADEVARDFIPPPQFKQLLGANNCILVGPRGSGKTTLLKMLQVTALRNWNEHVGGEIDTIPFVGIFVAADVRWAKQLELITKNITNQSIRSIIHEASFSNFVSLALIESLEKSIRLRIIRCADEKDESFSRSSEAELSRKLAEIWKTQPTPSLGSLKHALRVQQSEIPRICSEFFSSIDQQAVKDRHVFLGLSWLSSFTFAIETINDHFGCEAQKWALLVDELEIIPPDLLELILTPLRSVSGNILFKYAISPTGVSSDALSNRSESDPSQGNDFAVLRLSNAGKEDTRNFATKLLLQSLISKGLVPNDGDLASALGVSGTDEQSSGRGRKSEGETGRVSLDQRKKMFTELAEKDESFRRYLAVKKINISALSTSDKSASGTLVRKITPLVYLRNHVLKSWNSSDAEKRSKQGSQPYQKFPNILDLAEGNPRWILNLADDLGNAALIKNTNVKAQGVQSAAIAAFKDRFISMLRVYPVGSGSDISKGTPYDLLEKLGNYLREKLFFNEFSPDPALSFTIDSASAQNFGDIVSICIHLGALVFVDSGSKDSAFIPGATGLEDREVRICNRLAPEFYLPLRIGRTVKMNTVLGAAKIPVEKNQKSLVELPVQDTTKLRVAVQDKTSQMKLFEE
jgi:energy-coupling factor transporter ATP-binding protein EcfA2